METWIQKEVEVDFPRFKTVGNKVVKKRSKMGRASGGMMVMVREDKIKEVKLLKNEMRGLFLMASCSACLRVRVWPEGPLM